MNFWRYQGKVDDAVTPKEGKTFWFGIGLIWVMLIICEFYLIDYCPIPLTINESKWFFIL